MFLSLPFNTFIKNRKKWYNKELNKFYWRQSKNEEKKKNRDKIRAKER